MYLADNHIVFYLQKEKSFLKYNLSKKILKNGKIIHRPKFVREFKIFLKKNKIVKKFQNNVLYLITPPNFNEIDKEIIKLVFEDLPFQEMKIIKSINLYQLKKNTLWIDYNQDYAFLTSLRKNKKESIVIEKQEWNHSLETLIAQYLKTYPQLKKVILIGHNPEIPNITTKLIKQLKKIVLYYENYDKYLIEQAIRHNFS